MEDEGFQLVKRKKAARRKVLKNTAVTPNWPQESVDDCMKKILKAKSLMLSNQVFTRLDSYLKTIENHFRSNSQGSEAPNSKIWKVNMIVCYGIGVPSCSKIARYQTALLLILRDHFDVPVEVYDPLLSSTSTTLLDLLGLTVLSHNEEGKRVVERGTLFFMPHCGKELYNNLLWANWNRASLPLCVIIGNSFSSIVQNVPTRLVNQHYQFIYKAESLCSECPVVLLDESNDIFNDLSIHTITRSAVASKEESYWADQPEPLYEGCDIEIVRKS